MMRRFLWGGSDSVKKTHWVAWEVVTKPKKYGGLGISRLKVVNEALLAKWVWRFLSEDQSLWRKVVSAIHGSNRRWSFIPAKRGLTGVWLNIVRMEDKLLLNGKRFPEYISGVIGNGSSIRFWIDRWKGDTPFMFKWPNLFAIERHKGCVVNQRLQVEGEGGVSMLWNWSRSPSTISELDDLADCESMLAGAGLSAVKDKWKWDADTSGRFSLRSFKDLCLVQQDPDPVCLVKGCKWLPFKCKLFAWRAGLDRLPTRQALARRNIISGPDECILCQEVRESVDHLFTGCIVALRVWSGISSWINCPPIFAFCFKDLMDLHLSSDGGATGKDIIRGIIIATCWFIWKARNEKFFRSGKGDGLEIVGMVKTYSFFWFKNRSKFKDLDWVEWGKSPLYML
ncbi:putative reverse transcriptase zinc-binding domain-containing protein [Helianthus annuus]|nr:putative reverse transcriptase zinc-binding domain-containing protein [Helianthus annuus]